MQKNVCGIRNKVQNRAFGSRCDYRYMSVTPSRMSARSQYVSRYIEKDRSSRVPVVSGRNHNSQASGTDL